ncbi:hypothetical protein MIDIC_490029 [Alphaproteobacteria bacterium]
MPSLLCSWCLLKNGTWYYWRKSEFDTERNMCNGWNDYN